MLILRLGAIQRIQFSLPSVDDRDLLNKPIICNDRQIVLLIGLKLLLFRVWKITP